MVEAGESMSFVLSLSKPLYALRSAAIRLNSHLRPMYICYIRMR